MLGGLTILNYSSWKRDKQKQTEPTPEFQLLKEESTVELEANTVNPDKEASIELEQEDTQQPLMNQ